jgi:hypothetical protein
MKQKVLIGGLLLGALAVMIVMGVTTFQTIQAAAATGTETDDTTQEVSPANPARGSKDGSFSDVTDEYLAEALGITTDELSAARQAAWEAGLVQAVEQGLITQAQADELLSSGRTPRVNGHSSAWLAENGIDFEALLANELGISVDQLEAAYATARNARIDQAVADGSLTEEQASLIKGRYALLADQKFQDSMQSAYEAAVQQAVEDGVITQEQADLILAQGSLFDLGGGHGMRLPGMSGGMDGGRGHGHGHTRPEGGIPAEPTTDTDVSAQTETP